MTDCKNLDLARQWAADIDADRQTLSQDTIDAAADLIGSLPNTIVDGDKLRDWAKLKRGKGLWSDSEVHKARRELLDELEALLPAPESAAPRPEDVPVGEAWQVEVDGKAAIGYRNNPKARICWTIVYRDDYSHDWAYDSELTLVARLVPETADQDDEPVFDPAYTYRDLHGDEWEHLDGRWVYGNTHTKRVAKRKAGFGRATPPAAYGPYTRIEA